MLLHWLGGRDDIVITEIVPSPRDTDTIVALKVDLREAMVKHKSVFENNLREMKEFTDKMDSAREKKS